VVLSGFYQYDKPFFRNFLLIFGFVQYHCNNWLALWLMIFLVLNATLKAYFSYVSKSSENSELIDKKLFKYLCQSKGLA
jgi:hypothetical protein